MGSTIRRAEYFYTTVTDDPDGAYHLLSQLAAMGVNLLAFAGMPIGPMRTQLTLFPEDSSKIKETAKKAGFPLDGPHAALLAQGDDELGALAEVHRKLFQANVGVFASTGVADGRGAYGYILYVRPDDFERAAKALDL